MIVKFLENVIHSYENLVIVWGVGNWINQLLSLIDKLSEIKLSKYEFLERKVNIYFKNHYPYSSICHLQLK